MNVSVCNLPAHNHLSAIIDRATFEWGWPRRERERPQETNALGWNLSICFRRNRQTGKFMAHLLMKRLTERVRIFSSLPSQLLPVPINNYPLINCDRRDHSPQETRTTKGWHELSWVLLLLYSVFEISRWHDKRKRAVHVLGIQKTTATLAVLLLLLHFSNLQVSLRWDLINIIIIIMWLCCCWVTCLPTYTMAALVRHRHTWRYLSTRSRNNREMCLSLQKIIQARSLPIKSCHRRPQATRKQRSQDAIEQPLQVDSWRLLKRSLNGMVSMNYSMNSD